MDKRTWAEVDLDAIAHNIKEIRKITNPNAKIMAVVKADATVTVFGGCKNAP